jgi:hypothetical protein
MFKRFRHIPPILAAVFFLFVGISHASTDSGGGYHYIDGNEPDGPVFDWVDISATGTALNLIDDDAVAVALPFDFVYNGITYYAGYSIMVGSNGHMDFAEDYNCNLAANFDDREIPWSDANCASDSWGKNPLLAPWFDDLDPSAGGNVFFQAKGTSPNRQLVIQWDAPPYGCYDPADMLSFQVILYETTNSIIFQYKDAATTASCIDDYGLKPEKPASNGGSATVGLGLSNTVGLQYSANTPSITNGLAILFTTGVGYTVIPTEGIATGEDGSAAAFGVALNSQPTGDVVIDITSSNTAEGTASPPSLTFTNASWGGLQSVTVTGVDDSLADGDQAYSVELIVNAVGTLDANYELLDPPDVSVTNRDDETAGFAVSAISGDTTEAGGQASFTVRLTSQPTGDVVIGVTSSDTAEGTVDKSSLVFTPADWDVEQTVTVTGADDSAVDGNQGYTVLLGAATSLDLDYDGLDPNDVAVLNLDDDSANALPTAPVLLSPPDGELGLATPIVFTWEPSNDPDGDTVTYDLFICTNSAFSDSICSTPVNTEAITALSASGVRYAGTGMGVLIAGIVMAAGASRRRKAAMLLSAALMAALLLVSCGGGGGGSPKSSTDVTHTVTNLDPGTIYHWKVAASDGQGSTESTPWSFGTQ